MHTPRAFIDLCALSDNARLIKQAAGDIFCVLKCNAYGHGAQKCMRALADAGFDKFAVYSLPQAKELSAVYEGKKSILVMGEFRRDGFCEDKDLIYTVSEPQHLTRTADINARFHVEIDVGMNRSGIAPSILRTLDLSRAGKNIEGVYAHLSDADDPLSPVTNEQKRMFFECAELLERALGKRLCKHLSATSDLLRGKNNSALGRVGLALYGVSGAMPCPLPLRPVMSVYSTVLSLRKVEKGESVGYGRAYRAPRPSLIATVAGGYGNGIPRLGSNGVLPVIIKGQTVFSVGSICMDRFMVDVTPIQEKGLNVAIGDRVTLLGADDFCKKNTKTNTSGAEITANRLATRLGTIPYEILCSLGNLNPSVYYYSSEIRL